MTAPNRDNWSTPPEFREAVCKVFGWPSIDVCAFEHNCFSTDGSFYGDQLNGLHQTWRNMGDIEGYAWCNPPGSQVAMWVDMAHVQAMRGNRSLVLVQCGIESGWYQRVKGHCETLLLTPRIQFVPPEGVPKSSNPRNYMLLVFEPWMIHIPGERIRTWNWKDAK